MTSSVDGTWDQVFRLKEAQERAGNACGGEDSAISLLFSLCILRAILFSKIQNMYNPPAGGKKKELRTWIHPIPIGYPFLSASN